MNRQLRLEEFVQFIFAFALTLHFNYDWWLFWALLLTPDIGMLGYIVNSKVGALSYNVFHHKGVALAIFMLGFHLDHSTLIFIGILLFGHSSMDRIFGYGLKYPDDFKNTHLGMIGQDK